VTDKQGEDGDKETQASSGRRHRQTEATGLAAFSEIPLVLLRLLPPHLLLQSPVRPWRPPSPSPLPTCRCSRVGAATVTQPSGAASLFQEPGQGCVPRPSGSAASRRLRRPSGPRQGGLSRSARPTPSLGNSLLPRPWLDQRLLKEHRRSGPLT